MVFKEGETVSTNFPKTRFLSKVYVRVKGSFTLKHATKTTYTSSNFNMYRLLRQIRIKINNGFAPYQIGGTELSLYNLMNRYNDLGADNFKINSIDNVVSTTGAVNKINYTLELPITINERDSIGLILLQNEQTVVTLEVDCGQIKDIMTDTDVEVVSHNINITPVLETYSIPQDPNAVPDYSIIKLVNEQIETCPDERAELKAGYQATYDIIKEYAPSMMSEEEIRSFILDKFADAVATKNKGMIMKGVMAELKGKADGKLINQVVADLCK
jgi:uncharacterized protein YqeY